MSLDQLEERAAIIAEATPCSQWLAEIEAARQHGFSSWREAVKECEE